MNMPFQAPANAVRLFDVIKFKKEQAKLAFYFALSDTLYCENSDMGMQLAWQNQSKRKRVVSRTSRGKFIIYEVNGLMVGSDVKRGGFETKAAIRKDKQKG